MKRKSKKEEYVLFFTDKELFLLTVDDTFSSKKRSIIETFLKRKLPVDFQEVPDCKDIVPTITRIQQNIEVDVPVAAGEIQHISNPIIDLQELSTSVMMRDGQTLVLAGLISQIRQIEKKGLPFFSEILILGRIFRRTKEQKRNRELSNLYYSSHKEVR